MHSTDRFKKLDAMELMLITDAVSDFFNREMNLLSVSLSEWGHPSVTHLTHIKYTPET